MRSLEGSGRSRDDHVPTGRQALVSDAPGPDTVDPAMTGSADEQMVDLESSVAEPDDGRSPQDPAVLRVTEARRRSLRRWAIGAGALTAVAVVGATLTSTPVFDAKTIDVAGEGRLTEARVLRIAGIDHDTGVFRLDEAEVARRLELDPWIAEAEVTTSLPSTVRITIAERRPVAVIRTDEGSVLIAADGVALAPSPRGARYPVLLQVGSIRDPASATHAASAAMAALDDVVRAQVRTVLVDRQGLLSLHMRDGVTVVYGPATELAAKSQALRAILRWGESQPKMLQVIDLTVPGAPTARFEGVEATAAAPSAWPSAEEPDPGEPSASPSP